MNSADSISASKSQARAPGAVFASLALLIMEARRGSRRPTRNPRARSRSGRAGYGKSFVLTSRPPQTSPPGKESR